MAVELKPEDEQIVWGVLIREKQESAQFQKELEQWRENAK
jgi:hypothetical protein